jgi:LacI family transcriptional regulator
MAASVKDVAVLAGVSLGTVSNVLNRPDKVRAATRERVEAAMQELGFVRNESARQLKAGKSNTAGYIMFDASNPFFTDVAAGMESSAEAAGVSLFLCNSDQRPERERAYLSRLEQGRALGILITPVDPYSTLLDQMRDRGTPLVIVDRTREGVDWCTVAVDDELGGRMAVNHLLDLGHRRIAYVGGPSMLGQVRDRQAGAQQALEEAGRPAEALVCVSTDAMGVSDGMSAAERIAGMPKATRPTAVFCANDLIALGVLQRCVSLGLRVPGDLAIVGYDDIDFAAAAAVPLTSVRQPRREMGRDAARLLIDEATNPRHRHRQILFKPELVARASTRASVWSH